MMRNRKTKRVLGLIIVLFHCIGCLGASTILYDFQSTCTTVQIEHWPDTTARLPD